jgi:copper chaperone CopZ
MKSIIIRVQGMTCDHCVKTVQQALMKVPGVQGVEVSLTEKQVKISSSTELPKMAWMQAIQDAGYEVLEP